MTIFPLRGRVTSCRQRFGCLPWGKRPTLACVEENDGFKIEDDDEDDDDDNDDDDDYDFNCFSVI